MTTHLGAFDARAVRTRMKRPDESAPAWATAFAVIAFGLAIGWLAAGLTS